MKITAPALVLALLAATTTSYARDNVSWSVTLGSAAPFYAPPVAYVPPVVYAQPPVYYERVYVPAPPPQVIYAPAPAVVYTNEQPWGWGRHHHGHHRRW